MGFRHRHLEVYDRAVTWAVEAYALTERLPGKWQSRGEQLRRAATSIPLNIAEGTAESSPAEQRRFLRFARRSAAECDAAIHILHRAAALREPPVRAAETTLNQISAMLHGLIKRSTDH